MFRLKFFFPGCSTVLLSVLLFSFPELTDGQNKADSIQGTYLYFPYPMQKNWQTSLGFTLTIWPQDISEEAQLRVPAGDFHVIRKLYKGFYLDGQLNFQILQNLITLGPRWAHPVTDRFSFSIGDDIGWWFGSLNIDGFNTTANGWVNYPNISFGYRVKKNLLFTWKTEAIIDFNYHSSVGDLAVSKDVHTLSGWSTSLILEQPFYKKNSMILGVRAIYSNFYWQTWSLFETFDRNIFYPQIIVGFIL